MKVYGLLSFAKSIGKNIFENISNNLSSKYSHKLLDHAKQFTTDALKTSSKSATQNTSDTSGNIIGNEIANEVKKVLGNPPQNGLGTVGSETENIWKQKGFDKEIPKESQVYVIIAMYTYFLKEP